MNEAILMSQCHEPEYDLCDLNHALLGPPSEGDGTPTMLEVPWTYPIQDMRYSPRRSLRNAQKKTLIESEAPNHVSTIGTVASSCRAARHLSGEAPDTEL
jgi:hypothetical protein